MKKTMCMIVILGLGSGGCATGKKIDKAFSEVLKTAQGPCAKKVVEAWAVCSEYPPVK